MSSPRRPRIFHPLIFSGLVLFVVGLGASVFALLADILQERKNAYQGLLTFVLYPTVMLFGLGLFLLGRFLTRHQRPMDPEQILKPEYRRRHRRLAMLLGLGALLFAGLSVIGAFRTFQYTESEDFCGALCHEPMEPQHVAHQDSPHAAVECVACHVGDGAAGYIQAKVSGIHQMTQMMMTSYPRPIRVHAAKLPGVTSSCESCHWPERPIGVRLDNKVRFGYDLRNTERRLHVALKIGTGASTNGTKPWGAHWHAAPETRVYFEATDERELEIGWVKIERADGTSTVYTRAPDPEGPQGTDTPATDPAPATTDDLAPPIGTNAQLMDCLDCHNRPAHRFPTPDAAVDEAIASGRLPGSLPLVKKLSVEVLSQRFEREAVGASIRAHVDSFYADRFGGTILERRETLDRVVGELERLHRRSVFPEMKVDGHTYPTHAGHRDFPGCFRCHDGRLVSGSGEAISSDCSLCHEFFQTDPASRDLIEIPADGSALHPFAHEAHAGETCWSCHTGAASPYANCVKCHETEIGPHERHFECSMCHRPGEVKPTSNTCAPCHPLGTSALHQVAEHRDCAKCHAPHSWKVEPVAACQGCHATLGEDTWETHHPGEACSPCHDFRGVDAHLLGLPAKAK